MGHLWTEDVPPQESEGGDGVEHPIVALIAVVAIVLAIVLIAWARVEVHGTADLEAALVERGAMQAPAPEAAKTEKERQVDEAVTSSRFATGFSP